MRPPDMYDPGGSSSSRPHGTEELQPEVVLYTASASRRRGRTSADLYALRALLRGYGLAMDERDVSKSKAHRCELKSLLAARGCAFSLPQLLVGGRLVGGPDDVRQLHQTGGLRRLLDGAPRPYGAFVCKSCRTVDSKPCRKCSHSRNNKMLDHGIVEKEERLVLFYPTQDVSVGGRGRQMDATISVSLGAMRPLVKKLDMMLGPHGCKLTKGVNDRSQLLKDDLEEIGAYLEDLLEVEDPPLAAKCWMKEANELSYDILDCIDNIVPPGSLGYKSDHKTTHVKIPKRLKWQKQIEYACPDVSGHVISKTIRVDVIRAPRRLKWYQQMVEKLSKFRIYAKEMVRRYERYLGHCCNTLAASRFLAIGPMMPMPPPPCEKTCSGLVIDGRMSKFINSQLANDENQQFKVVSIHGSGCLGKTMLAKVLYNKIGRQFHCRAFIRVSKKPDMKTLFRDILSQIKRKHPQTSQDASVELRVTAENIRNYLHGKRYLIVVDDLWDTSSWDVINQVFPKGCQGSRIITTTQIEDVALACCYDDPEQVFEMKPLDHDHSRKLFFGRLFGSESDCPEEFKQVSSEIAEICGGLPVATNSIASLLANQPSLSMDLFTRIHDSLISCLASNSTSERTRHILNLSYNSLPHYLKTCLLHLTMYPEGSIIFKHDLVRQWVAERFIYAREGQDTEQVAGMYFDELVDRRFIKPMSINYNNEVVSCTVHSVVHDLIVHKSAEENFVVVVDHNRKILALSHKVHRLSIQLGDAKYAKIPVNIRKSQVRSLGFFGLVECMPCIGKFKLVRVLNLQLSGHHPGSQDLAIDLTGISELFHLIYLKIACDVCIKLPSRMRGLQCLETLDMMDTTTGTRVPWDIIYLPHLLHLSLPAHSNLLDWSVNPSGSLGMLNHLQDLYISTPPCSNSYHLKRSMQALDSFICEHGSLKTVKVVAHGSSVGYGEASKASVFWYFVKTPCHLQRFELLPHKHVIFSWLHVWLNQLGNLSILKIAVRELSIDNIDILKGLPALIALSLYVEKEPSMKIIFDNAAGFTALKYLKLRFMSGIAWLKFEADAMPNLWKLRLVFDAIPQMDQRLYLYSDGDQWKQYRHGTALISIEHMPRLREVSAKFGGAAADLEYVSMSGIVTNHPSNPIIYVQLVDSGSHGGGEVVSWSNTIGVIGCDLFIYCLHRLSRWDYGAIASLNRDFNSVVRNGEIYRLRRKNGVAEHWLYLSCGNNPHEWDAYDPSTGRWIQVPKMPPAGSSTWEPIAVGTELLVFGAYGRVALRYSILTNSWTGLADAMNTPRCWFASASVGEKAYVAGGLDSSINVLSSAEMYDSETHTWTPLPSMNRARFGCSAAFMDGKFYVIGGITDNQEALTCGEEYDFSRQSWRVIDNMSQGLNQTSQGASLLLAAVNNELYAADYIENDLKQYDKLDNTWITLGKLPVQSMYKDGWDMGFQACGERLIVIGPPINSTDEKVVEVHSWTPDGQLPVWNLFATWPFTSEMYRLRCAVMGC